MVKTYSIFVSHSWDHSNDLVSLHNLLSSRGYFYYDPQEVTKNNPINSENAIYIKQRLRERIKIQVFFLLLLESMQVIVIG